MLQLGELYVSPVGLSFISQTAPQGMTSLMMGVWMLGASAGLLFAGMLGATYRALSHPAFFGMLAAIAAINGALPLRPGTETVALPTGTTFCVGWSFQRDIRGFS